MGILEIKIGQAWALSDGNIYRICELFPKSRKMKLRHMGGCESRCGLFIKCSQRYDENTKIVKMDWISKKWEAGKAFLLRKHVSF